ncbi:MAG: ABC transporter substrate-binding protein [Lachnospiraceae bacterium]|jgi:peptide/nickel transport system substrate-binding protein|nr:ABC transporter substrate-binding protein [Lachnospiraceae bacterium]
MKKCLKKWISVILTLCMILTLAACGTKDNTQTGTDTDAADTSTDTGADATDSGEEKVLRMSRNYENATSWDPLTHSDATTMFLAPQIYEPLFHLDMDGGSVPWLATSYEVSDDQLTYTIKLQEGVQFHGGYGEMTSEDVKFSIERNNDEAVGSLCIELLNMPNIASIDTPDDYTVVFNLNGPDLDFITRLSDFQATVISKKYVDEVGLEGLTKAPIGTGPFEYVSGTPGVESEAKAFEDYWGGRPDIDRITYTMISDTNTNFTAFENGEIDLVYVHYPDKVNEFKDKGYIPYYLPTPQLLYLYLNMQNEPLDDPLVREAIFTAIDPNYFNDSLFYGTESIPTGWMPAGVKYSLQDYFYPEYNVEKAKELLAEAGYPDGLKLTLWSVNDDISPPPCLILEQQLKEVGITLELQLVDFNVFMEQVRAGTAPLAVLYNGASVISDADMARYRSEEYPGRNWVGLTNKEYDDLIEKALASYDVEEKTEYFYDAQRLFMDLDLMYPITTYGYYFMTSPKVHDIDLWGDLAPRLYKATMD